MSDRLTRIDWITQGLRTLANKGPNALKVGALATALEVSRGSFYWHFRDIADFRSQILQSWQERTTDRVIEALEAEQDEADRLQHLLKRAFDRNLRLDRTDRAIRAWAAEDEAVATIVAAIDARRVAYIQKLLIAAGVKSQQAHHRAAFLYWAYLGQAVVMESRHGSIPESALDDIGNLFEK